MTTHYDALFNLRTGTPQSNPIPGREEDMSENYAGGYSFNIDKWDMLDRFLILGSDTPTYYASAREITKENARNFAQCIQEDGKRVVDRIVEISDAGRAPKNDPALFALAACMSPSIADVETRRYAGEMRSRVARTGSHHLMLVKYEDAFRGWGRARKRATASWFKQRDANELAYQMLKYQSRYGYSQADVLRLSHPKPDTPEKDILFHYVTDGVDAEEIVHLPERAFAYEVIKAAKTEEDVVSVIRNHNLTREFVPGQWLSSVKVWEALVENGMPIRALLWNLAKLTSIGIIEPFSPYTDEIADVISDDVNIAKARIHPINVLITMTTYSRGRGIRGSLEWEPSPEIMDALDSAFYSSFKNLPEIDKNILIALDVSGSMSANVMGVPGLMARDVCAAMAMSVVHSAKAYHPVAFSDEMKHFPISRKSRLDHVVHQMAQMPFGRTDCALPMLYAMGKQVESSSYYQRHASYRDAHNPIPEVDAFVVFTDNETWFGNIHPAEALKQYQNKYNRDAKMVVCAVTATDFSIADPDDNSMLDIVGFDSAVPSVIENFLND